MPSTTAPKDDRAATCALTIAASMNSSRPARYRNQRKDHLRAETSSGGIAEGPDDNHRDRGKQEDVTRDVVEDQEPLNHRSAPP